MLTLVVVVVVYLSKSCNPMDYSLPGSSVYGVSQARMLEWVAISFSIVLLGLSWSVVSDDL